MFHDLSILQGWVTYHMALTIDTNLITHRSIALRPRYWRRCLFTGFFASLLAFCGTLPVHGQEKLAYTLAVVPQIPPLATHKIWAPFVERLEKDTGLSIKLIVYKTVPSFEVEVLAGKPDFVFMNPYHQVLAKKAQGYVPVVRAGGESVYGMLVVARDGPIQSLKDLNGKDIAFPTPNAYGASLYLRALLTEQIGIQFKPYYLDLHSDVYRHAILGKAAAGGAVSTTLNREPEDIRAQLRVLYKTPSLAVHPLSAHPRVPTKDRQAIQTAILRLGADPVHQELLRGVQLAQPVIADYLKDYQSLEKLGLEKYVVTSH